MTDTFFIVPESRHEALVGAAYRHRGYLADEAARWRAPVRRGRAARNSHAQRDQSAASRSPFRLRLAGLRPRRPNRGEAVAIPRGKDMECQPEAGVSPPPTAPWTRRSGWRTSSASAPFPSTMRSTICGVAATCSGRREAGLHRVHELYGGCRRGGPFLGASSRRWAPIRTSVGIPHDGGDRLPDPGRLGDIGGGDGARPATGARGQAAAGRRGR